jgi:hypothetical protein
MQTLFLLAHKPLLGSLVVQMLREDFLLVPNFLIGNVARSLWQMIIILKEESICYNQYCSMIDSIK